MIDQKVTLVDNLHMSFKDIVSVIQAIVTTIAIVVGGVWSYFLFVKKRQRFPRANISHQIFHKHISNGKALLNVKTIINNAGDVLLSLESGKVNVNQILPVSSEMVDLIKSGKDIVDESRREVDWPLIGTRSFEWEKGRCEIEPGENDHFLCDFIMDENIKLVVVYSYFENIKKHNRNIGWGITTYYELKQRREDNKEKGG